MEGVLAFDLEDSSDSELRTLFVLDLRLRRPFLGRGNLDTESDLRGLRLAGEPAPLRETTAFSPCDGARGGRPGSESIVLLKHPDLIPR